MSVKRSWQGQEFAFDLKYFIILDDREANFEFKDVQGSPIILQGFEKFKFFIFQTENELYNISECSTGRCVAKSIYLESTITKAIENLKKVGEIGFFKMLEEKMHHQNYRYANRVSY